MKVKFVFIRNWEHFPTNLFHQSCSDLSSRIFWRPGNCATIPIFSSSFMKTLRRWIWTISCYSNDLIAFFYLGLEGKYKESSRFPQQISDWRTADKAHRTLTYRQFCQKRRCQLRSGQGNGVHENQRPFHPQRWWFAYLLRLKWMFQ